ncbi:HD domain-containing protein (plasmid) [Trichlorobacter lovleyi]|uniref:HD domain-containing protein n=1 Tax=Trichlorobacter lovleyi TaxID=313985 RepID=UPI00223EAE7C|nr:HD domain-containing protein [Trichlorobacter lovleyi]QOX80779.1 HD domain-containing protein [Trichlorobacter lovleyi]
MPERAAIIGFIGISGVGLVGYTLKRIFSGAEAGGGQRHHCASPQGATPSLAGLKQDEQMVTLKKISGLWTQNDDKTKIAIEILAKNWCARENMEADGGLSSATVQERKLTFNHEEISIFYSKIKRQPVFSGLAMEVIEDILTLLDEYGDCPSVVTRNVNEPDKKLDPKVIEVLKTKVTLIEHTLNVTDEVLRRLPAGPIAPKGVIAALAHDLGKLPAYYDKMYATGDHKMLGISVLDGMPKFKGLQYADDILVAIRRHHDTLDKEAPFLVSTLKDADQSARRNELQKHMLATKDDPAEHMQAKPDNSGDQSEPAQPKAFPQSLKQFRKMNQESEKAAKEAEELKNAEGGIKLRTGEEDPLGNEGGSADPLGNDQASKRTLERIDVGDWFDQEDLLNSLRKIINIQANTDTQAFSMPDGTIYFRPKWFWERIKRRYASKVPLIATADADETTKENIIYSVVCEMSEKDAVRSDLLWKNHYGAMFTLHSTGQIAPQDQFLIPIKTDAFGCVPSHFEQLKGGNLKLVSRVELKKWR